MSLLGYFGHEFFGMGYFGVTQNSVLISGTLISSELTETLAQDNENVQQIDMIVEVAGIDVSSVVKSIKASAAENAATQFLQLVIIGEQPEALVEDASIEVTAKFTFENRSTFTNKIFSGYASFIQPSSGANSKSVLVYAYDNFEKKLKANHVNTSWSGLASDLIANELIAAGITTSNVDFADYTLDTTLAFKDLKELIIAVAGGIDEVSIFGSPSGIFNIIGLSASNSSAWEISKKGYFSSSDSNSTQKRFKSVLMQGVTGNTIKVLGSGTVGIDHTFSSPVLTSVADLTTKGQALIAKSERIRRTIQMPLNPLINTGKVLTVEHLDGVEYNGKVISNSLSLEWTTPNSSPGATSSLTMEVL